MGSEGEMLKQYLDGKTTIPDDKDLQEFFKKKGIQLSLEMIRYYRKRIGAHKKRGRKE